MNEPIDRFELRLQQLLQRLPTYVPEQLAAKAQSRATAIQQQSLKRREMWIQILQIRRYSYLVLAASILITLPCLSYLSATCIGDATAFWSIETQPLPFLAASITETDESFEFEEGMLSAVVIMMMIALMLPILYSLLPPVCPKFDSRSLSWS